MSLLFVTTQSSRSTDGSLCSQVKHCEKYLLLLDVYESVRCMNLL